MTAETMIARHPSARDIANIAIPLAQKNVEVYAVTMITKRAMMIRNAVIATVNCGATHAIPVASNTLIIGLFANQVIF